MRFFACGREDGCFAAPAASRCCACGRDGAFRAPARVTFFCCQKKVTKENHLDLRSKDPLARGGQVQIWRCWLRGIGAAGDVVGSGDRLYRLRRYR